MVIDRCRVWMPPPHEAEHAPKSDQSAGGWGGFDWMMERYNLRLASVVEKRILEKYSLRLVCVLLARTSTRPHDHVV